MKWLAFVILVAATACASDANAPEQPIAFDHKLHLSKELAKKMKQRQMVCTDCHTGAEKGIHAGLPSLSSCLRCHMKVQSARENEHKVRELAGKNEPFQWYQVTRNPAHVYFSHRPHVSIAKIDCEVCHGNVREWEEPPRKPNERLLHMSSCMACHRQRGVDNECGVCHK